MVNGITVRSAGAGKEEALQTATEITEQAWGELPHLILKAELRVDATAPTLWHCVMDSRPEWR